MTEAATRRGSQTDSDGAKVWVNGWGAEEGRMGDSWEGRATEGGRARDQEEREVAGKLGLGRQAGRQSLRRQSLAGRMTHQVAIPTDDSDDRPDLLPAKRAHPPHRRRRRQRRQWRMRRGRSESAGAEREGGFGGGRVRRWGGEGEMGRRAPRAINSPPRSFSLPPTL